MPKPTCQLNLTLDVPTAEWVERIAYEAHIRPSGAGRELLLERLQLEEAGWKAGNKEMIKILAAVCKLDENGLNQVKQMASKSG